MKHKWFLLSVTLILAGCASVVHQGHARRLDASAVRIFLPQFANATEDEHAARAVTELAASALLERSVPLVQTEAALVHSRAENAAGADGLYLETARSLKATHLLIGTVHEYRYKTDLDGNPAVGISLRLVDVTDGHTVWQGSSSRVSVFLASLSKTAQRAVRDLVAQLPLTHPSPGPAASHP